MLCSDIEEMVIRASAIQLSTGAPRIVVRRIGEVSYPNIHAPDVATLGAAEPFIWDRQSHDLLNKIRFLDHFAMRATLAVEIHIIAGHGRNINQEHLVNNLFHTTFGQSVNIHSQSKAVSAFLCTGRNAGPRRWLDISKSHYPKQRRWRNLFFCTNSHLNYPDHHREKCIFSP